MFVLVNTADAKSFYRSGTGPSPREETSFPLLAMHFDTQDQATRYLDGYNLGGDRPEETSLDKWGNKLPTYEVKSLTFSVN